MSRDQTIDYETFRKSRVERFLDWRRSQIHAFEAWRRDAVDRITQRGWPDAEAEVVTCKAIRIADPYLAYRDAAPRLGGWGITFNYIVNGKTYAGVFNSRDEVPAGEKFSIRFNPQQPEQNNTIDSELGWLNDTVVRAYDVLLIVLLFALIVTGVFLKLRA